MNIKRTYSGIGYSAVARLVFLSFAIVILGCKKSDLPPEQIAVDVVTKCVMGAYDDLDNRVAGDVKNFISRDRELRKNGRSWFASVKTANFKVLNVKSDGRSASVLLKAVLDDKVEEMPVWLEMDKDDKWRVVSFANERKQ